MPREPRNERFVTPLCRLPVSFPDKYRFWQEFVVTADREGGRVFIVSDERVEPGSHVELEVRVEGDEAPLLVSALVEARRPPSLRFSRGLYVRLAPGEVPKLRGLLGLLPSPTEAASGRQSRRYTFAWPVAFRTPALLKPVLTADISSDGMHVEMPERVRRGHVLEFTLKTPQGHELLLVGTVIWTSETDHTVGVRFLFPDEDCTRAFRGMLEHAVMSEEPPEAEKPWQHTVLVADDDKLILRMIATTLEASRYRVLTATTGEEALALIRSERPDLVLLDVLMPRLDGMTVCRAIRADAELCELPVIFVSALDDEGLAERAQEAGASDFLSKPVLAQELLRLVDIYIRTVPTPGASFAPSRVSVDNDRE